MGSEIFLNCFCVREILSRGLAVVSAWDANLSRAVMVSALVQLGGAYARASTAPAAALRRELFRDGQNLYLCVPRLPLKKVTESPMC